LLEHDMRVVQSSFPVFCLLAGAIVGALNRDPVAIDLGPVELHSTLGLSLIGALLLGALSGGAAVALGSRRAASSGFPDAREPSRSEA
jgi:putative membrane protein